MTKDLPYVKNYAINWLLLFSCSILSWYFDFDGCHRPEDSHLSIIFIYWGHDPSDQCYYLDFSAFSLLFLVAHFFLQRNQLFQVLNDFTQLCLSSIDIFPKVNYAPKAVFLWLYPSAHVNPQLLPEYQEQNEENEIDDDDNQY